MALVDDHHLARKAEVAQHHMLLFERRHEQLVHRANDKAGQQRLLAAPEPLVHLHPVLVCLGIVPVVFYLDGLFL